MKRLPGCIILLVAMYMSLQAAIIKVGDVLDIQVQGHQEFSGRYTVSMSGTIDYPLLADETSGMKEPTDDSSGGALTLKPSQPASGGEKARAMAAYPLPGDMDSLTEPFGNEIDEKLIAIYEKYYKNRK